MSSNNNCINSYDLLPTWSANWQKLENFSFRIISMVKYFGNRSYNDMTILSCSRILTQYKNSLTDRKKIQLKNNVYLSSVNLVN